MKAHNALPDRTITVAALSCRRGEQTLFADLQFTVPPGELLLLRGPNGVGKTTLLLALAGIIRPESGSISVTGRHPDDRPGTDLHLFGHQPATKARLSVCENLRFWADMFGGDRALIDRALEAVGLAHIAGLEAGYLSAGQTRRLGLARLLVADRPIWLLDEPTAALDSQGEQLVLGLIDAHLRRGGIAIAATHHDMHLAPPAKVMTLTLHRPAVPA
jgi:heme exporter protein A